MKTAAAPRDGRTPELIEEPWAASVADVLQALQVRAETGLSDVEAQRRLEEFGPNQLRRHASRSTWHILWDQFASLIVVLLAAAAAAAFAFGETVEGLAIVVVIFINAAIGFFTERRAVRSMEAIRALGHTAATVRRDGSTLELPARLLVPGDVVILDAGDVLTADVRLITASRMEADESPLTGESLPVEKGTDAVAGETALAERTSMMFKGTAISRGSGEAVVVATGMATEIGTISSLVETAEAVATPLEKRLDQLARRLVGLTLVIATLVAVAIALSGRSLFLAIEVGIALAVATIPEGLPIVATVALARGMWRMARRNALVEQLAAVETLGSTTIILTDKTGTLTENRMTVVEVALARGCVGIGGVGLDVRGGFDLEGHTLAVADSPDLLEALRVAVLCNNASLAEDHDGSPRVTGDPTEVALLVAGAKAGLARDTLLAEEPEVREIAFDPDTKRMATVHQRGGAHFAAVKGAPETVVDLCTSLRTPEGSTPIGEDERRRWLEIADELAGKGERVLALATRAVDSPTEFDFSELVLLGLVGFLDPPRENVREAIETCQAAGMRVVMVTGDHGATAWTVAAAVGLIDPAPGEPPSFVDGRGLPDIAELSEREQRDLADAPVIARATPAQKMALIDMHQRAGAVVAMTGDGVNDAPALKKADIGVAMGRRGTQVAREAADIVLQDDEFGTIVEAVAQGRAIFSNIRKFVVYLMSCNVSEVLAVAVGALAQGPLPILPLQILFLNLVTDVFPALALGVGEGGSALMNRPPRDPREPVLSRHQWRDIFAVGAVIAASVLGAMGVSLLGLDRPTREATTVAFLTLAMAQLWHVFTMRDPESDWLRNEITRNPWIWAALGLCATLLVAAVHWAPLAGVLSLVPPGPSGWALALGFSFVPLVVGQLTLWVRSRRKPTLRGPTGDAPGRSVRTGS